MLSLIRLLIASVMDMGIQEFYPDQIPMTEADFLSLQHLDNSMDWQVMLDLYSQGQFRSATSQPGPTSTSEPGPSAASPSGPPAVAPPGPST